jgi:hypothetical protein
MTLLVEAVFSFGSIADNAETPRNGTLDEKARAVARAYVLPFMRQEQRDLSRALERQRVNPNSLPLEQD